MRMKSLELSYQDQHFVLFHLRMSSVDIKRCPRLQMARVYLLPSSILLISKFSTLEAVKTRHLYNLTQILLFKGCCSNFKERNVWVLHEPCAMCILLLFVFTMPCLLSSDHPVREWVVGGMVFSLLMRAAAGVVIFS